MMNAEGEYYYIEAVKMPLLLLYRDGIVKLKMYWKIHKIY
jgi:hypothetical protein